MMDNNLDKPKDPLIPMMSIDSEPPEIRESLQASFAEQKFHAHITLGIEEKLKKNKLVKDVKMFFRKSCEKNSLIAWERKYGVNLPIDLKNFYLSTNGLKITWCLEHAGEVIRIGDINVNSLGALDPIEKTNNETPSPSTIDNAKNLAQKEKKIRSAGLNKSQSSLRKDSTESHHLTFSELQQLTNTSEKFSIFPFNLPLLNNFTGAERKNSQLLSPRKLLTLGNNGKAFRLDSRVWGYTCLVFPESTKIKKDNSSTSTVITTGNCSEIAEPEVWFLDLSYQWNFLAPSFTQYYRMLIIHFGLPQWQYRFTPFGLSSWADQMFWLVAPHLLQTPKICHFPNMFNGLWSPDIPTEVANPNLSNNIISMNLFRKKKKEKSQI